MTADRRNSARNLLSLPGLLLIVAAMCGCLPVSVGAGTAAAVSDPPLCGGVVCPKEKCASHLSYLHACCGAQPMCSCFDRQGRAFRTLDSAWPSPDCRSSCQCVKALDPVTFKYKLRIKCSPLRCPVSKAGCEKGLERCCSACKPQPSGCHSPELGRTFKDGEHWRPSVCRDCSCVAGRPVCTHKECSSLSCPPGLTPKALPKECCPSYCRNATRPISPYHSCRERSGNRSLPHLASYRPQWPCSPLTCICRHGDWECDNRTAACPAACARNRSVSLGLPGQCCPMCIGTMSCHIGNGEYRYAGRVWLNPGKKQQCACIHGVVECLTVPMSISTTSRPPPALGPPSLLPTWVPILLVVLGVLILFFIFAIAFVLRERCDSRFCALFHFSLGCWPRPGSGQSGAGKASFSMHYKKGAEAEVMIGDVDENANPRAGEAFA